MQQCGAGSIGVQEGLEVRRNHTFCNYDFQLMFGNNKSREVPDPPKTGFLDSGIDQAGGYCRHSTKFLKTKGYLREIF